MSSNLVKGLTVVSTYVEDRIFKRGKLVETRPGGPAFYIEQALRTAKFPHTLIVGKPMQVDIELKPGESERGRIVGPVMHPQRLPDIRTDHLLLSTLWTEWDLGDLLMYEGRIFLDIQGYVRNPLRGFGVKQQIGHLRDDIEEILKRVECIKGTMNEVNCIWGNLLIELRGRCCLITTLGKDGVRICGQGRDFSVRPEEVLTDLPDTLGAGDTFFAHFVAWQLREPSTSQVDWCERNAQWAVNETVEFLKTKLKPRRNKQKNAQDRTTERGS